ncbi:hypothetical protein ACFUGD_19140 [Streptomyces sp. NPDC057217]|uniref:hypothetical protein n=1 Tax=unclassified Streptomyces TaxID=2593676 RepID=UPI003644F3F0
MLFSVPVHTWALIAAAGTVMFMITMEALGAAMIAEAPEELREAERERRRKVRWVAPAGALVLLVSLALAARVNPEGGSLHLYLYGVAMASLSVGLLPFRRRMCRHHFAQPRNPGAKPTMDRLAAVWLHTVLVAAILAAVLLPPAFDGTF